MFGRMLYKGFVGNAREHEILVIMQPPRRGKCRGESRNWCWPCRLPHIFMEERNAWISCENVTNRSDGSGTRGGEKCREESRIGKRYYPHSITSNNWGTNGRQSDQSPETKPQFRKYFHSQSIAGVIKWSDRLIFTHSEKERETVDYNQQCARIVRTENWPDTARERQSPWDVSAHHIWSSVGDRFQPPLEIAKSVRIWFQERNNAGKRGKLTFTSPNYRQRRKNFTMTHFT